MIISSIHAVVFVVVVCLALADSSSDTVALWVLLACHYFYCTGHQATIPSIKFDAAFVGFPGDMENLVLPG